MKSRKSHNGASPTSAKSLTRRRRKAAPPPEEPFLLLRGKSLETHLLLVQLFRRYLHWIKQVNSAFPAEWGFFANAGDGFSQVTPPQITPAEMIQRCGNQILFHPRFWEEVHNLAQQVAKPFVLEHVEVPDPGSIRIDEQKNRVGAARARAELQKLFRVLARTDPRHPRRYHDLRTLQAYKQMREQGLSEKKAVATLAQQQKITVTAVRSRIRRARLLKKERTLPFRKRKPRLASVRSDLSGK